MCLVGCSTSEDEVWVCGWAGEWSSEGVVIAVIWGCSGYQHVALLILGVSSGFGVFAVWNGCIRCWLGDWVQL